LFWHLYNYSTRGAAEAAKAARGTVVESFGKVWLYTIAKEGAHPSPFGTRGMVFGVRFSMLGNTRGHYRCARGG
jgi:hypothetical protein